MKNNKYLSIPQVAKFLGLSRGAVYKRVINKQIKAIKVGRNYIIPSDSITSRLHTRLSSTDKHKIERVVKRVINEYGETLRMLGDE